MPLIPFKQSGTGNPQNILRRLALQAEAGVYADSGFLDFYSNAGPIAVTPSRVGRGVITGSGARLLPQLGPTELAASQMPLGGFDPANKVHLQVLGNVTRKFTVSTPTAGVYKYTFSTAAATVAPALFTLLESVDTGVPTRFHDVRFGALSMVAAAGGPLEFTPTVLPGGYSYHGPATLTGTGTGLPRLFGTWDGNHATTDRTIRLKTTDDAPPTVKTTIGAAGTYSGADIVVTLGGKAYLTDGTANNLPLGSAGYGEQQQVWFPSDAVLVVDDVYSFAQVIPIWTPNFAPQQVVPVVNTRFFMAGYELAPTGWTVNVTKQPAAIRSSSGRQPRGTLDRGEVAVAIDMNRQLVDLDAQNALAHGAVVTALVEFYGAQIGATAFSYGGAVVIPSAAVEGSLYGVPAGGGSDAETITLQAGTASSGYSYLGVSYTEPTVVVFSDVSTIAS